jgi:hypothetical protein
VGSRAGLNAVVKRKIPSPASDSSRSKLRLQRTEKHTKFGDYLLQFNSERFTLLSAIYGPYTELVSYLLNELYFWTLSIVWCLKKIEE